MLKEKTPAMLKSITYTSEKQNVLFLLPNIYVKL